MTTAARTNDRLQWLKWIDRLNLTLAVVGGLATVGLMINVAASVLTRFVFGHPLPGALALTQFAWMPTLVSLGLGYALLRGEHIRVNLLTAPTGPRVQRIIEAVGMALTLGTTGLFIWFSTEKAAMATQLDETAVGAEWVAVWPYRWVLVAGLIGLLLQSTAQFVRAIGTKDFRPIDDDEAELALEAEETVFDELGTRAPDGVAPAGGKAGIQ
ncbi:TRAP transporter small permease subunit [Microbacterium trichothecenolyticum]|uniref:Tripartite ATP-independent periplasmic transporter, DctQ component n=1 Tax=Microbacterium trichothecenolyticum TaxID=69370 RepID=A0A0M2H7G1_MICTR|nr:TRAP transporter small permease [Microbacterium trichothecenolyticum]KJL42330.1 Tripartite ATP-independent periplasmic transporter, DctQ component [Microbacterium trichothecenolyticum]